MIPGVEKWRPAPFLVFTIVVSVVGVIGAVAQPAHRWAYISGVLVAQVVLIGSGFVPRSRLQGPNISRLSADRARRGVVALTFDDGPDPDVTPGILEILARREIRATFFCVGKKAKENPRLFSDICEAGHEIGNHSWSHFNLFWFLGPRGLVRELGATQALCERLTGQTPLFFRAPAGIRSPLLDAVLARLDLRLVSWSRRGFDTVDGNWKRVLRRLTNRLAAGDIILLHDGSVARGPDGVPVVFDVLPRLLDSLEDLGFEVGFLGTGESTPGEVSS